MWFRALTPVLGAGALTAGAISAGTLLGLAVGSAVGGRRAAASGRPLLVLAAGEALGALLCAALLPLAGLLSRLVEALGSPEAGGPMHLWTEGRLLTEGLPALLGTLACAGAALPLGLSLPAACRALDAPGPRAASAFRRLYAWNTLGAVLGVLLGGGLLLEVLGSRGSMLVAAAAQGLVALAALALAPRLPAGPAVPELGPVERGTPPPPGRVALAAFLAGGAGLAVQVAWVRRLTPAVGTTTQAFTTVLAAYLGAIMLGSLLLGPRRGAHARAVSVLVLVLGALPAALLPEAIAPVARRAAEAARTAAGDAYDLLAVRAAAATLLLVPSTLLCAAALPWLLRLGPASGPDGVRRTGRLLAWNTGGSALLALLTGLVWLPAVGSAGVLRGAAGLLLVAAALLAGRRLAPGLALAGVLLLLQPWVLPREDAAGRDAVGASFLPDEYALADAPALFHAEGRATTVVVRDREGRRELWVEGKIEASTQPTDLLHLTLLGSLPLALHPDPRRVGIVGLGTGRTAQAVAAFAPRRLVIFELEPEVLRAAPLFAADGAGVPAGAAVVLGDARRSLRASSERFDVLTSDPVHPGVAGAASLYAREYYALVRERLAPGGLLCQWLPLYQLGADDVRLALRTFVDAFPETWLFLAGSDLIVIGSLAPLAVDEAALRARLAGPAGAPLAPLGLRSPGRLLALVLRGPRGTALFAGPGPLNTDDRLLLEYRAGRAWFVRQAAHTAALLRMARPLPAGLLSAPPSTAFEREVEAAAPYLEALRAWLEDQTDRAVEAFDALVRADPADLFARRMRDEGRLALVRDLRWAGREEEALLLVSGLADDPALDDSQRLSVAQELRHLGRVEQGRALAALVGARRDSQRARRLAAP